MPRALPGLLAAAAALDLGTGVLAVVGGAVRVLQGEIGLGLTPRERCCLPVVEGGIALALGGLALVMVGVLATAAWWRFDPRASGRRLRRLTLLVVAAGAVLALSRGPSEAIPLVQATALAVLLASLLGLLAAAILWMASRMREG